MAPALCLADGVTGLIDAGSQGADRIEEVIAVAKSAPQQCRVLINIGRAGILPEGDTMDLSRADVGAAREAIGRNREMIVGSQGAAVARRRRRRMISRCSGARRRWLRRSICP